MGSIRLPDDRGMNQMDDAVQQSRLDRDQPESGMPAGEVAGQSDPPQTPGTLITKTAAVVATLDAAWRMRAVAAAGDRC